MVQGRDDVIASQAVNAHLVPMAHGHNVVRKAGHFARRKPLGFFGGIIIFMMTICALLSPIIVPYNPVSVSVERLRGPSWTHPMGTDHLGRDVLSRIIAGTRPSLFTGLLVVSITAVTGTLLGVSSAYYGGPYDLILQRIIDGALAFPALVFTLTFLTIFRDGFDFGWLTLPGVWHSVPLAVAVSIVLIGTPINTRIVRAATLSTVNMEYVQAAHILGCSNWRIIWRHLIPNVVPVVIVVASSQLGTVILLESAVSFLGLGLPPPHASWGGMLQASGRQFFDIQPGLAIFPGSAIIVTVMAINLLGDALRDVLDPRLRGS